MKYSIFQQALTIAVILLISKIIESFIPIPMPAQSLTRTIIYRIVYRHCEIRSS